MDKAKIKCLIVYGQISPGNAIHFSEKKAVKRRSNHFVETPFWLYEETTDYVGGMKKALARSRK